MALFKSRQGRILWQELPEFHRLFDAQQKYVPPGGSASIDAPGDLKAYLYGFGHVLDRFAATLEQFYADGFMSPDPVRKDARELQPWLVPYFADLFGVTLYGPDPESRRSELAQSIWVARRRGTRLAVDKSAESILGQSVVAVPGLDRVLFAPSIRTPLLTQAELTGEDHPRDAIIRHEDIPAGSTATRLRARHHGLALGTRDVRWHMRAGFSKDFRLDTDSKPVRDPATAQVTATRFTVRNRAGVPCFPYSYEDRALRTPDSRGPRKGWPANAVVARPDAVVLHVDPPPGFFDGTLIEQAQLPVLAAGELDRTGLPEGRHALFRPAGGAVFDIDPATARPGDGAHEIEDLFLDGSLVVKTGAKVRLTRFAVRDIRIEQGATLVLKDGICEEIEASAADNPPVLECVTVMGKATLKSVWASDCILGELSFLTGNAVDNIAGCLRFCRVISGQVPTRIKQTSTTRGAVPFLDWPCLPDPTAAPGAPPAPVAARPARFGELGYGVLSDAAAEAIAEGSEDGSEPGAYHHRFHLARLRAAERRARDYAPAGYHVFARYDLRSAAPLPKLKEGSQ